MFTLASNDSLSQSEIDNLLKMIDLDKSILVTGISSANSNTYVCCYCWGLMRFDGLNKDGLQTKFIKMSKSGRRNCSHFLINLDYLDSLFKIRYGRGFRDGV